MIFIINKVILCCLLFLIYSILKLWLFHILSISSLSLENRKKLLLSGVEEIVSFQDEKISLNTVLGNLTIKGSNLHINKINLDSGDLELDGEVYSLEYAEDRPAERGFFSKLFR